MNKQNGQEKLLRKFFFNKSLTLNKTEEFEKSFPSKCCIPERHKHVEF